MLLSNAGAGFGSRRRLWTEKPSARTAFWAAAALFTLCFIINVRPDDAPEPLIHMGVICLQEEPLASQFAERLVAKGKPVFYLSDIAKGISQGDIIRFRDKAVLIDGDVWQTLMSMGILNRLKNIPLMTLTAQAKSDVWGSRSSQVSQSNDNKGYTLGRELLKIFEEYFGKTPSGMEMVIKFHGTYLTMVAPNQLLNELQFAQVARVPKTKEKLFFITSAPPGKMFVSQEFSWTVWAIDPQEYMSQLQYSCTGDLPPGLSWDAPKHTLRGTPGSAGVWRLSFSVKNSKGQSASTACTLVVVQNTAPRVQARFGEALIAGTRWEYTPFISDAEHALDELELRLFYQPQDMTLDQRTGTIAWNIPGGMTDSTVQFIIGAKDPLGAATKEKMALRLISPATADQTITIDFRLPLDTMIQGHAYSWPDDVWMKAEWHERSVKLKSISGDDSTRYRDAADIESGELRIRPMRQGIHTIVFTFLFDTMHIEIRKQCTVLPNRPPVFYGTLSSHEYYVNQFAEFNPAALDEDGDSLAFSVVASNGTTQPLTGSAVQLSTQQAGLQTLTVIAEDPFGNRARRQIYYSVKPPESRIMAWYVQKSCRMTTELGFRSGGLRFGLLSADIGKTVTTGVLGLNTFESPFLFFGANPLGSRQAGLGNFLFIDGGISFRVHNDKLYSGGIVGRLQSNYRHQGTSPWRFQTFFSARLKQAMFIADTTGMMEMLENYIEGIGTITDSSLLEYVIDLADVFGMYGREDNFGLYLQLQTLYRFPAGFWFGPVAWLEDDVKKSAPTDTAGIAPAAMVSRKTETAGNIFVQYTGFCLLHEWRFKMFQYSQQLHVGWSVNSFAPRVQWLFIVEALRVR